MLSRISNSLLSLNMERVSDFYPKLYQGSENFLKFKGFPLKLRILKSKKEMQEGSIIRYKAYASKGLIQNNEEGEYWDKYDCYDTTVGLGAYEDDRLVGTMRLCFSHLEDTLETLPCGLHYPELVKVKEQQSGALLEISRLAIDPLIQHVTYKTLIYGFLVRSAYIAAKAANVSMLLVVTKPEWIKFYKHMLGCEKIGSPAFFAPGTHPKTLMAVTLEAAENQHKKVNTFFRITQNEIADMQKFIWSSVTS